jgi:ribonuclease HII
VSTAPSLRFERELLRRHGARWLAAVDEVGRGALGGPVTVGVVLVDLDTRAAPTGVRDSKLLTPAARQRLVPRLQRWAPAWAVGHASAAEIDAVGILRALRLAGERAFAALPVRPDHVLLDGSYDWISRPAPTLFDDDGAPSDPDAWEAPPPVTLRIKADLTCSSVAAASVLAKTTRDALMVDLARLHTHYGWELNKGYASPEHRDALQRHGPCEEHRRSWSIPGGYGDADAEFDRDADGDLDPVLTGDADLRQDGPASDALVVGERR